MKHNIHKETGLRAELRQVNLVNFFLEISNLDHFENKCRIVETK